MDKPTITQVVGWLHLEPDRNGFIRCPVHEDKTPSCQLHEDWWYCFACQASGDSLGLIAAVQNRPISDVLREYGKDTKSWTATRTKHIDPAATAAAPWTAYRTLQRWFFHELASRMGEAPDWLTERTIMYWSGVFEDDWQHWFDRRHPEYDETTSLPRKEERLAALVAVLERGLGLSEAEMWDVVDGEWFLKEAARVAALRDKGVGGR